MNFGEIYVQSLDYSPVSFYNIPVQTKKTMTKTVSFH